jgi:hypothetical protein
MDDADGCETWSTIPAWKTVKKIMDSGWIVIVYSSLAIT